MKLKIISLAALMLSGCTTSWDRPPGKTQADFYNDGLECKALAMRLYANNNDPIGMNSVLAECMQGKGYTQK